MNTSKLYLEQKGFPNLLFALLICATLIGCTSDSSSGTDDAPNPSDGVGEISGTVVDEDGNFYDNVALELKQGATLKSRRRTDEKGLYSFTNIAVDNYDLELILPLASEVVGLAKHAVAVKKNGSETIDFTVSPQPIEAQLTLGSTDLLGEVKKANGEVPTSPGDLLYAVNVFTDMALVPILAPGGEQVKLGDWNKAKGSANIHCDGDTTQFEFSFSGLLPEGVYTLWLVPYDGSDVAGMGTGALGDSSGSDNVLVADAGGMAETSIIMTPGSLSVFGSISSCVLTNGTEMIMILDYHIDQKTHGTRAGPDHTEVSHMSFVF